jgi:hypothetical protein
MLLHAIPAILFPGNIFVFNAFHTVFFLVGIFSFAYITNRILPESSTKARDTAMITSTFAFHPTIMGSAAHFNVDTGILVFFLLFWALLMSGRTTAATCAAVCLAFTKEPAVALMPLPFFFTFMTTQKSTRKSWFQKNIRTLIAPYTCLAVYAAYKVFILDDTKLWATPYTTISAIPDIRFFTMFVHVFVMGFAWLLIGASIFYAVTSRTHIRQLANKQPLLYLWMMTVISFGVLSVVRTVSNPRYLIVPMALVTLATAVWILTAGKNGKKIIFITAILMSVSCIRTIDPVAQTLFGTFRIGNHRLLSMTNPTGEYDGYGRDQLSYNLEFLALSSLFSSVARSTATNIPITFSDSADFPIPLDKTLSFLTIPDARKIRFAPFYAIAAKTIRLPAVNYIAFPYVFNRQELAFLSSVYRKKTSTTYTHNGYELEVFHFSELRY